jgi:hypothetical protein
MSTSFRFIDCNLATIREHFARHASNVLPFQEAHTFPLERETGTFEGRTVVASQKTWFFNSEYIDYCWTTRLFFEEGDPVDLPLYLRVDSEKCVFRLTEW